MIKSRDGYFKASIIIRDSVGLHTRSHYFILICECPSFLLMYRLGLSTRNATFRVPAGHGRHVVVTKLKKQGSY